MGPIHEDIHLGRGGKALIDAAGLKVDHISPNYTSPAVTKMRFLSTRLGPPQDVCESGT